jgi:putative protease
VVVVELTEPPALFGQPVGRVKEVRGNQFTVAGLTSFANGDGLSFVGSSGQFEGFRVNRVEENRLFPARMPDLKPNTLLYRTHDQAFESLMEKPSAERKIPVAIHCWETAFGFSLSMEDAYGNRAVLGFEQEKVQASKPQEQQVKNQLTKLGNTFFEADSCTLDWTGDWFVPVSAWAEQRRMLCEQLMMVRKIAYRREEAVLPETRHPYPESHLTYLGNVLNQKSAEFYRLHGVETIDPAFESDEHVRKPGEVLMFNKHCIKYELGACPRVHHPAKALNEPLCLVYNTNRIQLHFDCKACEMHLSEVV